MEVNIPFNIDLIWFEEFMMDCAARRVPNPWLEK